ncbi:MAG: MATE family efflux transporter [Firmicutes bacterium]|nr:MATE family efflux transporter [Bacillota bacterium]
MARKKDKEFEMDMVRGPVLKKMLVFSLPLMLSSILQLLFNAVDLVVVGRFAGDNAMAAVGSNSALIALMTNLFVGLSVGANVTVARFYGAKREQELSQTVHTTVALGMVSGVLLAVLGVCIAKPVLILMGMPEDVLPLAVLYLRIYFLGMTGMMVYNFGSAILRAVGDTKRPLYYLAFSGVINLILNLFFVIKLEWGVAGVGASTVIAQTLSAILILKCLTREEGALRLDFKKLRLHKNKVVAIFRIGVPSGVNGMVFSMTNMLIQASVNSFGAVTVAGSAASANIENIIYFAMNSFYQATISFTSQNVGAKRVSRIDRILKRGLLCVVTVGFLLGFLAVTFGETLLGVFSTNDAVIAAGMERLRIIGMLYFLCGAMDVTTGALRGMGYSLVPMVISLVGVCGIRILWITTIFQIPKYHTVPMLFMTYPVTWMITLSALLVMFFVMRKKLREKAVAREL